MPILIAIALPGLSSLLIYLIVFLVFIWLCYYIINNLAPEPIRRILTEPIRRILIVVLVVVAVLVLLYFLLGMVAGLTV